MNILITGASRGLGLEWVKQFLQNPQVKRVYAVSTHGNVLESLQSKNPERLFVISTSITEDSCVSMIQKVLADQPLDVLINNAGVYYPQNDEFEKINLQDFEKTFAVNSIAPIRVVQAGLAALLKSKHPKLIQISSLMGSITDNTSGDVYSYRMSKAALNMFNKSFSIDYPQISSVVLHPGWVKTDMGGNEAPTTIPESVTGMMKLVLNLSQKQSGQFFDFEGDTLPW
jgi:NAD(P)-dependent dehydrogenase (short-subunit alcohol dehydrogenase family)